MAWLDRDDASGRFRIAFRFGGRSYKKSLKTQSLKEAEAIKGGVARTLLRLEQGLLELPLGADLVSFVLSDGKHTRKAERQQAFTLQDLVDRYQETHSHGALEANSLDTALMHLRHFTDTFGDGFALQSLSTSHLQRHVDRRAKARGHHGRKLSPTTVRKEIASFRAAWNWAVQMGWLTGSFPNRGVKYPKTTEKPPFQTRAEIEAQLARGAVSAAEERELWDCLFLTLPEITELLQFVLENARHPFLYPMFCFAAHTGARRSEVVRSRLSDFDFKSSTVVIHKKKRTRGVSTSRRVPLSPYLCKVMQDWFTRHPGGDATFGHELTVERSKKDRSCPVPLTRNEANDHFRRTLAASKWDKLRGWHVFRHSFASNCAAMGIDQRVINTWLGHQTEEMVRRYRHLLPDQQQRAIQLVFGQEGLMLSQG